jgi:hypothetical protein
MRSPKKVRAGISPGPYAVAQRDLTCSEVCQSQGLGSILLMSKNAQLSPRGPTERPLAGQKAPRCINLLMSKIGAWRLGPAFLLMSKKRLTLAPGGPTQCHWLARSNASHQFCS